MTATKGWYETLDGGNDLPETATPLGRLRSGEPLRVGHDAAADVVQWHQTDFVSIDGRHDRDYFSFGVDQAGWVTILLEPLGGTYLQGEVGHAQYLVDATASNNLDLVLTGPLGLNARAVPGRAGVPERIDQLFLPRAGDYSIAISGTRDTVQLYRLQVAWTAEVPEPPIAPTLVSMLVIVSSRKLHRLLALS